MELTGVHEKSGPNSSDQQLIKQAYAYQAKKMNA